MRRGLSYLIFSFLSLSILSFPSFLSSLPFSVSYVCVCYICVCTALCVYSCSPSCRSSSSCCRVEEVVRCRRLR